MPRYSRLMTNGQIKDLAVDCKNTFAGCDEVTGEGLAQWVLNTQSLFNRLYERFEYAARIAVKGNRFHKYLRDYRPFFLEWAAWEIIPIHYADKLRGFAHGGKLTLADRAEYDAGREVFEYFISKFAEENGIDLTKLRATAKKESCKTK